MKKILLLIALSTFMANAVQAASPRCKESVTKLVMDLEALGGNVANIDLTQPVTVEDVAPVLDQITNNFYISALFMDSMIGNNYSQEEVDAFATNQYKSLTGAFARHEKECPVLYESIKEAVREGVEKADDVIAELESKKISRLQAAAQIDEIAEELVEQAIRERDIEKARRAAYLQCLQENQESQCKK